MDLLVVGRLYHFQSNLNQALNPPISEAHAPGSAIREVDGPYVILFEKLLYCMAAKRSKIREVDVPYVWCSAKMVARNTSVVGICGSKCRNTFRILLSK